MKARRWMEWHIGEHVDPQTNEVCCTALAEDYADTILHRAAGEREFEAAFEAAEWFERTRPMTDKVKQSHSLTTEQGR